jgi:hypothetical protein
MKPPKQMKRVVRVKVVKDQGRLRVYGALFPKPTEAGPKFTTFFKQLKIVSADEKTLYYNVPLYLKIVEKTYGKFQLKRRPLLPVPAKRTIARNSDIDTHPNLQPTKVLSR